MKKLLKIKIIPKSQHTKITEMREDGFTIKLKAVPEKGRANKELIKFLSKKYKTPQASIKIIKGETSRWKTIQIDN